MSRKRSYTTIAADFETTVYDGQTNTEVWAAACVELETENVKVFHSIDEQFEYYLSLNTNLVIYYHNLKFDGSFWLDFLEYKTVYKQALDENLHWKNRKEWKNKYYSYNISDMGQWYSITIKTGKHIIEIRDSLKLLPFSLAEIGNSFQTKHKKLEMEYTGYRYAGCAIAENELLYIANDVLVLKEALEIMFSEGHDKLTIGSCCLDEYYKSISKAERLYWFGERTLDKWDLPPEMGAENVDAYIRKAYKGGWCYLVKGKENRIFKKGVTADVNSLYPSMMHSESGNKYPIGDPYIFYGKIPDIAKDENHYYFVRFTCRFEIKKGKLPFIQIKGNPMYKSTECLETSDIFYKGKYYSEYYDLDGELHNSTVELTLTCVDFNLFLEHYNVHDLKILDGIYFYAISGIFDAYIDKYRKIKMESKGAKRTLAKLFLNNLYGKMASSPMANYKIVVPHENALKFMTILGNTKKPGFIPVGAAITSYARNFTIRAAQANFYGYKKPGFIYADTDSIHCDLPPEKIKGIKIDSKNFCCWKLESYWDRAIFVRQKTYIEHVTHDDGEPIKPEYSIKCAGMPKNCKELLKIRLENDEESAKKEDKKYSNFLFDENGNFKPLDLSGFTIGLVIPGKLQPKRIPGGILLVENTYELR